MLSPVVEFQQMLSTQSAPQQLLGVLLLRDIALLIVGPLPCLLDSLANLRLAFTLVPLALWQLPLVPLPMRCYMHTRRSLP